MKVSAKSTHFTSFGETLKQCVKNDKIGSAGSGPLCGGTDRWRSRRFPGDSNLEFDNC